MMKKKILIGSIFAALLMVSMPLISALQTQSVATSTTTTSVQPTKLAAVVANANSILSIDPETATPQQMINTIQLSIQALKDLGYTDKAASFSQQLQTLLSSSLAPQSSGMQWGLIRCGLVELTGLLLNALAVGILVASLVLFIKGIMTSAGVTLSEAIAIALAALGDGFLVRFGTHCSQYLPDQTTPPTGGCILCGDATGSTTPMPSN